MSYGIEIIQEELRNGFLGGHYQSDFSVKYKNILFDISINQSIIRSIKITTDSSTDIDTLIDLFNKVDMLIMLGEGHFINIKEAKIINNEDIEEEASILTNKLQHRLKMYNSADYVQGRHSYFLSFDKYLNQEKVEKWFSVIDELDILHQAVLYAMADTGVTIDCKCAVLIESFKGLSELIEIYINQYNRPSVKNGESKLGVYLSSIIDKFGIDIFAEEISVNKEKFMSVLVNSRNRIAHIKSKQNKLYLSGVESVLYAVKLSFLYRIVLLEILEVDYSLYSKNVKTSISKWNKWNGIMTAFKKKL